jgi:hypothetical protein
MSEPDSERQQRLASFLDPSRPLWRAEDLGDVLEEALDRDLDRLLAGEMPADARQLRLCARKAVPPVNSLAELFAHPSPPRELLEAARRHSKEPRLRPTDALPPEVGTLLYYVCLAVEQARLGGMATRLSATEAARGFRWAAEQAWAPEPLRRLCREAGQALGGVTRG